MSKSFLDKLEDVLEDTHPATHDFALAIYESVTILRKIFTIEIVNIVFNFVGDSTLSYCVFCDRSYDNYGRDQIERTKCCNEVFCHAYCPRSNYSECCKNCKTLVTS